MANEPSFKNLLRRTEDLANSLAKDYTNLHLIARGSPTFVDENLSGRIRFAKRQGNFLPVIAPQNSTELAEDAEATTRLLKVTKSTEGFVVPGAVISIGPGRELAKIFDIDVPAGEITVEEDLIASHEAGTRVDLYGIPIEVIGAQPAGDDVIQVRSTENIFIGDQIAIDTTKDLINSTVSTLITGTVFLGTAIDGRFNYELTLTEGISRSLLNEEDILLSAQPGYESASTRVTRINGPFVIDFISGPFFEDTVIDEYLNIQLFSPLGDPLPGFEDPVSLGKNSAVAAIGIKAESMLFWDVIQGSVQLRDGRFVAITDDEGKFALTEHLIPSFPVNNEWEIPVRANEFSTLRIKFDPNDYRTFSLSKDILTRVTVGMSSSEQPGSRVEIAILSQKPNAEIEFNNWLPTTSSVSSIIYQITSTAFGDNIWQAGSLILKPYFFTLEDIAARYDFSAYDNGVVHF